AKAWVGPNLTRCDLVRIGVHGSEHLHWERAELHGQEHRGKARNQDAIIWGLYGVFRSYLDSFVRCCVVSVLSRMRQRSLRFGSYNLCSQGELFFQYETDSMHHPAVQAG